MMTSAFISTLSFSAEQNWAQNSGAKRRDDINSLIMTGSLTFGRTAADGRLKLGYRLRERISDAMRTERLVVSIVGGLTVRSRARAPPRNPGNQLHPEMYETFPRMRGIRCNGALRQDMVIASFRIR